MAAPAWQATGSAVSATTGTLTVDWPTHAIGDVALLFVEQQTSPTNLTTANGFVELGGSVNASGTTLSIFWCRATSNTMASPVVGAATDHSYGLIITFRGCASTGTPFTSFRRSAKTVASTTDTAPAVTTLDTDQLIVVGITKEIDATTAFASGQTNANLSSITERFDAGTISGNGGGISIMHGLKADVGDTGTTAITVTSSIAAIITIALRGDVDVDQEAFRFYEDGTEAGSTAIAAQDTNITRDVSADSNLQLRIRAQNDIASAYSASDDYLLQYSLNSGDYRRIAAGPSETLLDSYSETNSDFSTALVAGGNVAAAQSFAGASSYLTSAKFYLKKTGTPTGNAYARLYSIASGTHGTDAIPGTILASSDPLDVSTLTTSNQVITFKFNGANQYLMSSGTNYMIGIEYYDGSSGNTVSYGVDLSSPTHAGNLATISSNTTAAVDWTNTPGIDLAFYVYTASGTSPINGFNSASLTDGNATTNRLGAGAGSFVAGKISEDGLVDNHQITASNFTEYLYSLTLVSAELANADTLDFQIVRNGFLLNAYNVTPRITVDKGVASVDVSVSDTVTLTESVQLQVTSFINTSDSTTLSESVLRLLTGLVNVSDSITVTESFSKLTIGNIAVSDTVTLTESITVQPATSISVSDSISVTENVTNGGAPNPSVSDSITTLEAVLVSPSDYIAVMDSPTVTESVLLEVAPPSVTVNDSVTVSESIKLEVISNLSVSDTISLSESTLVVISSYISVADSVTVTESVSLSTANEITVSDSLTVSESVALQMSTNISVSDTITVTESVTNSGAPNPSASDSITVSEAIMVSASDDIAVMDSPSVTEAVQVVLSSPQISVSDSINVSESVQLEVITRVSVSDSISITESVSALIASYIAVTENITVSDSVLVATASIQIAVSDSTTVTESVSVQLVAVATLSITVNDTITITENVLLQPFTQINVNDSITLSESFNVQVQGVTLSVLVTPGIQDVWGPKVWP